MIFIDYDVGFVQQIRLPLFLETMESFNES